VNSISSGDWSEWYPFERVDIGFNAPSDEGGVSCIGDSSKDVVYIGRAESLLERLREHETASSTATPPCVLYPTIDVPPAQLPAPPARSLNYLPCTPLDGFMLLPPSQKRIMHTFNQGLDLTLCGLGFVPGDQAANVRRGLIQ